MKYLLIFLLLLTFIAPSVEENPDSDNIIGDTIYNYITCLDRGVDYLSENVPVIAKLSRFSYNQAYKKVMSDRTLIKHLVTSGETLDDIIKKYNSQIDDIENFRKVVYMENQDSISSDYEIMSGGYITVPTD